MHRIFMGRELVAEELRDLSRDAKTSNFPICLPTIAKRCINGPSSPIGKPVAKMEVIARSFTTNVRQ